MGGFMLTCYHLSYNLPECAGNGACVVTLNKIVPVYEY